MANVKIFIGNGGLRIVRKMYLAEYLDMYMERIFNNLKHEKYQIIVFESDVLKSINRFGNYSEGRLKLVCKLKTKREMIVKELERKKLELLEVHNLIPFFRNDFIEYIKYTFQKIFKNSLNTKGEVRLKPSIIFETQNFCISNTVI